MNRNSIAREVRRALMLSALAAGTSLPLLAQEQPGEPETIVVTGSRIKRTEEGALPVETISAAEIQRSGATNAEQFLQTVSVAVQGNSNVVAATGSGASTGGVSGVSLRGLGSQRTLVLINGRRVSGGGTITDSTTVDVNSIPVSALERVEVLKDGASAIYGSDAIAGVVNFIIRDNYQGAEMTVDGGGTQDGGGSVRKVTGLVGFGDLGGDRFNVMLTGSFQKDAPLIGSQRDFATSGINQFSDSTSGNAFPANFSLEGFPDLGNASPGSANSCAPSVVDPNFAGSPVCRFDPSPFVSLLPKTERWSTFASAHFALTDDVQLYGEASLSHNTTRFLIQPNPLSEQFALPDNNPLANVAPYNGAATIILSPTSAFYPTAYVQSLTGGATPDLHIFYRSFITGNRDLSDISSQPRAAAGIKGKAAGWDFDASAFYSETKLTEHVNDGYPLYSQILPLLNSGRVNFFGPNTPEVEAAAKATNFTGDAYATKTSMTGFEGAISKDLFAMPAGALAVAFSGEARKEKFSTDPSATSQTGDIAGYGGNFLPQDSSRNVYGVSAEVSIPIAKGLTGDAAVRYDNYQGSGSKTVPKFSLGWKPVEEVLVRGSYGKGFRAPSLTELFQPQTQGVTGSGLTDPQRCVGTNTANPLDCNTQFGILAGGNTKLAPEESKNYTLGVVFEPSRAFSIGFDAFKIQLDNTIIFGVDPETILNEPQFAGLITRAAPDTATPGLPGRITQILQTNQNFGTTKVAGVDVDTRYQIHTDAVGTFSFSLVGSFFSTYQVENLDGSFRNVAGKVSPVTNGNGGVIPRWHHYLSAAWTQGLWDVALAQNFQSSYGDILGSNEDSTVPGFTERHVASYSTLDVSAAWSGISHLRLAVGARNALNKDPPYTNAGGGQNYFQANYDPGYADPRGRFVYGTVTYSLK